MPVLFPYVIARTKNETDGLKSSEDTNQVPKKLGPTLAAHSAQAVTEIVVRDAVQHRTLLARRFFQQLLRLLILPAIVFLLGEQSTVNRQSLVGPYLHATATATLNTGQNMTLLLRRTLDRSSHPSSTPTGSVLMSHWRASAKRGTKAHIARKKPRATLIRYIIIN